MATSYDVKAIAKLLKEGEFGGPEEAARAVLAAYDARREGRMGFAVVVNARPVPFIYIGHENREEAIRWCKRVGLDVAGLDVWVIPVLPKDRVLDRHLKQDDELAEKNGGQPATSKKRSPKRTTTRKAA